MHNEYWLGRNVVSTFLEVDHIKRHTNACINSIPNLTPCSPLQKWRAATKPQIQIEVKKMGDIEDNIHSLANKTTELNVNGDLEETEALPSETLLNKEKEAEANHTSHV